MKPTDKLLNICFGFSLIYWGLAGFYFTFEDSGASFLRIFITLLNITVGILILFRKPANKTISINSILISLPSLICGGLLFKLSTELSFWSVLTEILFIFGGTLTFISFLFLGRSFSIFPGIRQIVDRGVYQIVRHPAYLGESIMIAACLIEAKSSISIIPFIIFIPSLIIRINEEERLLMTTIKYQNYKKNVIWKIIPYVW